MFIFICYFLLQIRFFDIGKLIEEEERNIILRRALHSGRAFDFENYHTYTEVNKQPLDWSILNFSVLLTINNWL